jgi:hypothetical protein
LLLPPKTGKDITRQMQAWRKLKAFWKIEFCQKTFSRQGPCTQYLSDFILWSLPKGKVGVHKPCTYDDLIENIRQDIVAISVLTCCHQFGVWRQVLHVPADHTASRMKSDVQQGLRYVPTISNHRRSIIILLLFQVSGPLLRVSFCTILVTVFLWIFSLIFCNCFIP